MSDATSAFEREQRLVRAFFGDRRSGIFVDVGAADPEHGSQTWHLEQADWSGVLIEPRADAAADLRRASVYEVACSSPGNAGRYLPLQLGGVLSSLNETLVIAGLRSKATAQVLIRTLDQVLAEAQLSAPIDFVSIDIEGHEVELLKEFDLARWRPSLILIEDLVHDLRLHRALARRGYRWVGRTGVNAWYVPADAPQRIGWVNRLRFVRKYYLGLPPRQLREALRRLRARPGSWSED